MQAIFDGIDLAPAFQTIVDFVGDQVTALIPIGIGLVLLLAVPRIVRRLINTFI